MNATRIEPISALAGPRISVIVPVYNDPPGISCTLDSILGQGLAPEGYEVLVVDNGSTDTTPAVIRDFAARHPERIRSFVERDVKSSYAARNLGVAKARAPLLAFLDADVTVPVDYLDRLLSTFDHQPSLEYLGCRVDVHMASGTLASKYDAIHAFPVEKYFELYRFAPTCCLTVRRGLFERAGPFNPLLESGGDTEFAARADTVHASKRFVMDLVVRHPARETYRDLLKKRARLGRGAAQLHALDPARFARRSFSVLEHLIPSNPLRIQRDARQRRIPLSTIEAIRMSPMKLPLTWTHWLAFAWESRRLRKLGRAPPCDEVSLEPRRK